MGRHPKPSALKLLDNRPGRIPPTAQEPKPRPGIPLCPAWLSTEAKVCWAELAPELAACGLITKADGHKFAAFCWAWAEWKRLATEVSGNPTTFTEIVKGGFKRKKGSIEFGQALQMLQAMDKLGGRFGLSPSDRVGLRNGENLESDDELAKWEKAAAEGRNQSRRTAAKVRAGLSDGDGNQV